MMAFLIFSVSVLQVLGLSRSYFPVFFYLGSGIILTYLVFSVLMILCRTEKALTETSSKNKLIITAAAVAIFSGLAYSVSSSYSNYDQAPIFYAWLGIFYFWILAQAYFISSPMDEISSKIKDEIIK